MDPAGFIIVPAAAIVVALALWTIIVNRSFAPWIPSSARLVAAMLSHIHPAVGSRFADLGCGDGRILTLASRRFALEAHGYEISPLPSALAAIRVALHRFAHRNAPPIVVHFTSLFKADLSRFDIIFIYGLPAAIAIRLSEKMQREVRPGAWIISYNFSLPNKKAAFELHEKWRNCYLYRW